jgi:diguanylate cyclase (GGDEF)-like protein
LRRHGGSGSALDGRTSLVRDPALFALLVVAVTSSAWFVADLGGTDRQIQVLWVLQVPLDSAFCFFARRVGSVAGVTRSARQFWYVMSAGGVFFVLGDGCQAIIVLRKPDLSEIDGGPLQTGLFVVGASAIVVNMLRYPTSTSSRGERLLFWLDAATVLVGGAALAWCFAVNPTGAARTTDWLSTVAAAGVVLVAIFAALRLVLSGGAPVTRTAGAAMISATIVQTLGIFVTPSHPTSGIPPALFALRLIPSVLLVCGPRIQQLQARSAPATFTPRSRRPFSVLPYTAVAATFVVLLAVLPANLDLRVWGVVVGAVLITALVVARQLLTFRENFELISQLDATLLDLRGHQNLLRDQASHDDLTGLANRTAFGEQVTEALKTLPGTPANNPANGMAVLLIDLDDFKTVNDTLGHATGDALLIAVADRLRGAIRPDDVVGRLGGDEFAVLLRGVTEDDAGQFTQRILADVARPVLIGDHTLVVRASVGVAPVTTGDDLDGLLRNADIAMYAAKDSGKSTYQQYAPDMGARILETAQLGIRLRDAIGTDQFYLVYQPIVALGTGQFAGHPVERTVGAEALVRWRHPERGLVSPVDFIPAAERTGLIVPLGRWILREACRQAAVWRWTYLEAEALGLSVNVAGRQLQEPGFVDDVAAVLAETAFPADRLTIEVTETAVLQGGETTDTLHALRRLGVGLALDDFGTAASSLGLLLTCPVSSLKLDRSFVDGLVVGSRQAAVANAVVQIARALDLTAVAEGIETVDQADLLHGLGYRLAQGYLYSRPLPSEEFARMWASDLLVGTGDTDRG